MSKRLTTPDFLVYDIETSYVKSNHFRLGKQVLRHDGLDRAHMMPDIICIAYRFGKGPVEILHWGHGAESSSDMIKEFDKIIVRAQSEGYLIVGKNNKRFDNKHINTMRWIHGHQAMPEWMQYTDDLESQMRKYLALPSYSLDFLSKLRGKGGKIKMYFQDWVDTVELKKLRRLESIVKIIPAPLRRKILNPLVTLFLGRGYDTIIKEGEIAFAKMLKYCKKDVKDTSDEIYDLKDHFGFKSTTYSSQELTCLHPGCAGGNKYLKPNGFRTSGGVKYRQFRCFINPNYPHYAGRCQVKKDGTFGKMMKGLTK